MKLEILKEEMQEQVYCLTKVLTIIDNDSYLLDEKTQSLVSEEEAIRLCNEEGYMFTSFIPYANNYDENEAEELANRLIKAGCKAVNGAGYIKFSPNLSSFAYGPALRDKKEIEAILSILKNCYDKDEKDFNDRMAKSKFKRYATVTVSKSFKLNGNPMDANDVNYLEVSFESAGYTTEFGSYVYKTPEKDVDKEIGYSSEYFYLTLEELAEISKHIYCGRGLVVKDFNQ